MKIDLHGLDVQKATAKIMNALFMFENDDYEIKLKIVTGKGAGVLQQVVEEILESENIIWEDNSRNPGQYIIKK